MRNNPITLICLMALLAAPVAHPSAIPFYRPKQGLPRELTYLVQSLQESVWNQGQNAEEKLQGQNAFHQRMAELDRWMQMLRPEEITLTVKSEVYKAILAANQEQIDKKRLEYDPEIASKLKTYLLSQQDPTKNRTPYHSFAYFLADAIQQDLESLTFSANFRAIKSEDQQLLPLKRKLNLLYPWAEKILETPPHQFNLILTPLMQELLDQLIASMRLQVSMTRFEIPAQMPGKLMMFAPLEGTALNPPVPAPKTVEETLAKLPTGPTPSEPVKKAQGWTPKDLPANYPTPDAKYRPPATLPRPTDEW